MTELQRLIPDLTALAVFLILWLGYEPLLGMVARRGRLINRDMVAIRLAWMRAMISRDTPLTDSQLMGHALNSASFFASSNLILIAGAAGLLFGGEGAYRRIQDVPMLAQAPRVLFEMKLALIGLSLARGLLDFIWSIRQMNYCLALIGAAPRDADEAVKDAYAEAASGILNPALATFSAGVRGYYFALAAAAWLFGPVALVVVTLGSVGLLAWRQSHSPAAIGVARARALLDGSAEP